MTSVLSGGALMAGASTGFFPLDEPMNTSFTLMAVDISSFQPVYVFKARMDTIVDSIKSSRPRRLGDEILRAGERSLREERRRLALGIPLNRTSFSKLNELSAELSVSTLKSLESREV
jgi:LDH2 family malate/lactate/ureidoglycolate dehydrogenase